MTAEIVIMNKSAVALAADSAVTVRNSNERGKIFNTANKVFSLSKYAPVGIMVSGGAVVMGVPWEVIIKKYREVLKTDKCNTIEEYCEHFFDYLDSFPFESEAEKQHLTQIAVSIFSEIHTTVDSWVKQELAQNGPITNDKILAQLQSQINSISLFFEQRSENMGILDNDAQVELHDRYKNELDQLIKHFFEKYALNEEYQTQLRYIVLHIANTGPESSQIVIAGFGENEYFPHCRSFYVGGVVSNHTIRVKERRQKFDIGAATSAVIVPFAQHDEVETFISGVSPILLNLMEGAFQKVFGEGGELPEKLFNEVVSRLGLKRDEQGELNDTFKRISQVAYEGAMSQFHGESRIQHSDPIMRMTQFLNKDELARMAETLINLESFRKQVASDEETVGGPIDVAVITKGDGLIWIKRKHYFHPDLNHHFFRNYFTNYHWNGFEGDEHECDNRK